MAAELSGVRKSAILLLSLSEDVAAEILKKLPAAAVEELTREIAQRPQATQEVRYNVFNEFYSVAIAENAINEGGLDRLLDVLPSRRDTTEGVV